MDALSHNLHLGEWQMKKCEVNHQKLISNSFDKLHEQLSIIRAHIQQVDDPEAEELFRQMEIACLSRLRSLRLRLEIPYDGHETNGQGARAWA